MKPKTEEDVRTLVELAAEDEGKGIACGSALGSALKALDSITNEDRLLEPVFLKMLKSRKSEERAYAIRFSGVLKSRDALPTVISYLKRTNVEMNRTEMGLYMATVLALGSYGKDALPELLQIAKETKDKEMHQRVAAAIAEMKEKDVVSPLLQVAKDREQDTDIRSVAIERVVALGASDSADELMEIYKSEKDKLMRCALIGAVGKARSESTIPFLETILFDDPDALVRGNAASALGDIGGRKVKRIVLSAWEKEKDLMVRADLATVLRKLTGKEYDWQKSVK
ncbi:MAG: HEAT repeat domain-containing protein [Elusimicrobia bacterium]|nr:HEAT repeat domain-containing protein [Elusimicrobiota bacterium]